MLVIGLTGGIGTGKSEVTRLLRELGAAVINADQVGHQAYAPNTETWRAVVRAFGEEILQPSGEIDRRKLGAIVFADPQRLATLNQIMHPRMARMVADRIEELRREGVPAVVVEAAVLLEAGWDSLVEEIWVVDLPETLVIQRVQARSGLAAAEIKKRIEAQMPAAERRRRADVVIDNSGDLAALENQVKSLWHSRIEGRKERA